jgi:hypothetical protein
MPDARLRRTREAYEADDEADDDDDDWVAELRLAIERMPAERFEFLEQLPACGCRPWQRCVRHASHEPEAGV